MTILKTVNAVSGMLTYTQNLVEDLMKQIDLDQISQEEIGESLAAIADHLYMNACSLETAADDLESVSAGLKSLKTVMGLPRRVSTAIRKIGTVRE